MLNLLHPGENTASLIVLVEFYPIIFDITPVILMILFDVWQQLAGITATQGTRFFHKQHFYKHCQDEIGKKSSKNQATP